MSTVATDHELADGPMRRCFLKIEGEETIIFQGAGESIYNSADFSPAFARPGKICLHSPEEVTSQLDIGEMRASISAMTFLLDDIDDTDGKSWWGKRFAPAAWDNSRHWRIAAGTTYSQVIDADATAITLKSATGIPEPPVPLYIGRETISYTGIDGARLTGVTKGRWPAVGTVSNYGYTYPRPQKGEAQYGHAVSQAPFSWMGRLVALYSTTYDRAAKKWNGKGSEELVWAGRISDRIQQRMDGTWALSCVSILEDLNRKIGTNFPTTQLAGINLTGNKGRKFIAVEMDEGGGCQCYRECEITAGTYVPMQLVKELQIELNKTWIGADGTSPATNHEICILTDCYNGSMRIVIRPGQTGISWNRRGLRLVPQGYCHALAALGFHGFDWLELEMQVISNVPTQGVATAPGGYYDAYHPLRAEHNGSKLYVDDVSPLWPSQGDISGEGNVVIDGASFSGGGLNESNIDSKVCYRYSARDETYNFLTISHIYGESALAPSAHAGQLFGEAGKKVQQAFIPYHSSTRGPFGQLLFALLSTGTTDYNTVAGASYDKLPVALGLGIPEEIVDKDSFTEADAAIMVSDLAQRKRMIIDEAIGFSDLLLRECKLWGYAVCWRAGKLSLRPIAQPEVDDWDEQLDDSNTSHPEDFLEQDWAAETVVNQYKVIIYDPVTGKKLKPIIVTDMDSRHSLSLAQQVILDHPGIWIDDKMATANDLLKDSNSPLLGRIFRFPSPIMSRTLGPSLVNKVFVGDVVYLSAIKATAADGSGDRVITCYATVIDVRWNYKSHTGDAVLLLHTHTRNMGLPWCPSALVDKSENGGNYIGGWDSVAKKLKLIGKKWGIAADSEDGAAFVTPYAVTIIETTPSDPADPQKWTNTVADSGYSASTNELALTDAMAGWDATKEYAISFGDYSDASTAQQAKGTWQAAESTELLNASDMAQKWG